jgi:uncharacterized protein
MNAFTRYGNHMFTAAGGKYYPLDPKPHEVNIETIAHHLSNRCRYNGATRHPTDPVRQFYSVAEHSVYCSYIGEPYEALDRLLHDASEAYNGDLIRPLKYDTLFAKPFQVVERLNEDAIARRFGLRGDAPSIKVADEAVTAAEVQQIIEMNPAEDWSGGLLHDGTKVAPLEIQMLMPHKAKKFFLHRFYQLWDAEKNWRRQPKGANSFGCFHV